MKNMVNTSSMMKVKLKAILILLAAFTINVFAQNKATDAVTPLIGTAITTTTVVTLTTPNYPSQTYPVGALASTNVYPLNTKIKSAKLYAMLDVGDRYKVGADPFTASIGIKIEGLKADNTAEIPVNTTAYELEISNQLVQRYKIIDFADNMTNLKKFRIQIVEKDINTTSLSSFSASELVNNLRVRFYYEIEYLTDVRTSSNIPAPVINNSAPFINEKVHEFSWLSTPYNFPNYQFELLRLYNIDPALSTNQNEIEAIVDWSKALKIETQSATKTLKISIAEGTGFYIWRVRGIGDYYEGQIANFQNWGAWSSAPADGTTVGLKKSDVIGGVSSLCYFTDHDEAINWIYSRTFSEGNRISEKISYANTLQQQKQVQAHLPSAGVTVVSQTENDFSGRPAITTMPVPVIENSLTGFKPTFVTTAANAPLRPELFDLSTNYNSNVTIDSTAGYYFDYYSDNNCDLSIPSASGYPYTRTLFYNDGTGRVKEQSGFGKIHAIGEQTDGKGRTTKTLYGTPSQDELIRVFGDEAPDAASVFKTITIDPNNTQSVAYTSKEGNVIATCLIKDIDNDLSEVSATNYTTFTSNNLIERNTPVAGGFISSKRLSFSKQTKAAISYKMNCNDFDACPNAGSCTYKLQIYIHDLKRNITYQFPTPKELPECVDGFRTLPTLVASYWVKKGTDDEYLNDQDNVPFLDEGDYLIEKYVYADTASQNASYDEMLKKVEANMKPVVEHITLELQSVTNKTQLSTFYSDLQTVMDNFETETNAFNPLVPASYTNFPTVLVQAGNILTYGYNSPDPDPKRIEIKLGCCNQFSIPIRYTPAIVCYTANELKEMYDGGNNPYPVDFEGYAMARLGIDEAGLEGKLPGFDIATKHELNGMIYHMLTDEYLAGNSNGLGSTSRMEMILSTTGPASYTATESGVNDTVQYKCEDLWKCWIAVVNQLDTAKLLNYNTEEGDDQLEIMKGADDANEENEDANGDPLVPANDKNSSTTSNNTSEENASEAPGVFEAIINWILNKKLTEELHKKRDGQSGSEPIPAEAFEANMVNLFLDCAGYRFAEILTYDGLPSFYTDDNLGDFAYDKVKAQATSVLPDGASGVKYIYPHIRDPKWAFKYFVYTPISSTLITTSNHSPSSISTATISVTTYTNAASFLPLEFDFCFSEVPRNLCEKPSCYNLMYGANPETVITLATYTYVNWNIDKRVDFYNELKTYSLPKAIPSGDMDDLDPTACPSTYTLSTKLATTINDCNQACEERRTEIRNKLIKMYLDNCYVLEGCASNTDVITLSDIDKIVDAVIDDCRAGCDDIQTRVTAVGSYTAGEKEYNVPTGVTTPYSSTSAYPKTYTKSCLNYIGDQYVTDEEYCVGFILPRCEMEKIDQVKGWTFEPALPAGYSKCDDVESEEYPPKPEWFTNYILNAGNSCIYLDDKFSHRKEVTVTVP